MFLEWSKHLVVVPELRSGRAIFSRHGMRRGAPDEGASCQGGHGSLHAPAVIFRARRRISCIWTLLPFRRTLFFRGQPFFRLASRARPPSPETVCLCCIHPLFLDHRPRSGRTSTSPVIPLDFRPYSIFLSRCQPPFIVCTNITRRKFYYIYARPLAISPACRKVAFFKDGLLKISSWRRLWRKRLPCISTFY